MLPIEKLPEPLLLTAYKEAFPDWGTDENAYNRFRDTDNESKRIMDEAIAPFPNAFLELRESLLRESKYVCAYCGQRVETVENEHGVAKMKVEHFIPQGETEYQLKYQNLLAVCKGNQIQADTRKKPKPELHCDSAKGETSLQELPNPAILSVRDSRIGYYTNGENIQITTDDSESELHKDLIHRWRLNLNEYYLCGNRYAAFRDKVLDKLGYDEAAWDITQTQALRDEYAQLDAQGRHKEFKDFILWYLDDKIRSLTASQTA